MNREELQTAFRNLPPCEDDPEESSWEHRAFSIRDHVKNDELDLLLKWSTIEATMFVGEAPYIKDEFETLENDRFAGRWLNAIKEPGFGNPPRLSYSLRTSGNLVHQAYHLFQFEKFSDKLVYDFSSIFEFGGGYGAMAYIVKQLGFNGRYVIYDLPEISLIQRYYLSNIGLPDVECVDVLEDGSYDLFIACYSLTEVGNADFMNKILETAKASNYLFVFVDAYSDFNNIEFLWKFIGSSPPWLSWTLKQVPHRNFENCWYLIGS